MIHRTTLGSFLDTLAVSEGSPQAEPSSIHDRIRVVSKEEWDRIKKSQVPTSFYYPKKEK